VGSSAAELCAQERQMSGNILAHRFPPMPSTGLITKLSIFYSWPQPSGLVRLESMQGLWKYHNYCVGTHIQSRQGHPQNIPSQTSPPNLTLQHQTFMQVHLNSWKVAELEQFGTVLFPSQKGAKRYQNGQWHAQCTPTSHFSTQPDC